MQSCVGSRRDSGEEGRSHSSIVYKDKCVSWWVAGSTEYGRDY